MTLAPFAGNLLDEPPARWLGVLTRVLDEQRALCESLEALSVRQSRAVKDGDTDGLLRILAERQVVIDRVAEVNAALEPFRTRKERVLERLGPAERDAVAARIAAITGLVEAVQARDEADRRELEAQRSTVAQQLGGLARGRGAVAAYGNAGVSGGFGGGAGVRQDQHG